MTDSNKSLPGEEFGIRVLLIDDQPIVGEQVRRMLQPEEDISFRYCSEPGKALATAEEFGPTVILQDLVMPDVEGTTLVKFFKAHSALRNVPLIVLSTKEEAVTKADCFTAGANDYLVKLPDRVELVARIRYHSQGYIALLERNRAYDELEKSQQLLSAELARAAEYVISLLPPPLEEGEIRTQWKYIPSERLGGDSLGYHWIDSTHLAMYLLDVCDHGVGSALLSVSALNVLRSHSLAGTDFTQPSQVLKGLNDVFPMEKHNSLYFTIWYGVYDREARSLSFASGGHPPALLATPDGGSREFRTHNLVVGGMPGISYSSDTVDIPPGSSLFIFSDGVYEITRPDKTLWTFDEFRQYLITAYNNKENVLEGLYRHVHDISGRHQLDDDFSMLKVSFQDI